MELISYNTKATSKPYYFNFKRPSHYLLNLELRLGSVIHVLSSTCQGLLTNKTPLYTFHFNKDLQKVLKYVGKVFNINYYIHVLRDF